MFSFGSLDHAKAHCGLSAPSNWPIRLLPKIYALTSRNKISRKYGVGSAGCLPHIEPYRASGGHRSPVMNPLPIPIGPVSSSCADSSQTTSSRWFHIQWSPRLARGYARCGFWSEISEVTNRVECLDLSAFLVGLYACHNMGTFKLSRPIHRIVAMVIDV